MGGFLQLSPKDVIPTGAGVLSQIKIGGRGRKHAL